LTQAEISPPRSATCDNCGATTGGAYCPVCGQDTKREPPTVGEFFHKRARYLKPLKLYFAAIVVAFAAAQFLGWNLGLRFGGFGVDVSFYLLQQVPPLNAIAQGRFVQDTNPWVLDHVDTPGVRRLNALSPEERAKAIRERGIHYLPYFALALVPIYAALLHWIFRARDRRYGADLVFALYVHSFFLLIFVIEAKLPLVVGTMLSSWAIVYYALALKRVYAGTWGQTIGRGVVLTLLYSLTILAIGFLVTAAMLSI